MIELWDSFRAEIQVNEPYEIACALADTDECECLSRDLADGLVERVRNQIGSDGRVVVVGSAKLGFSLKELAQTGSFRGFRATSDIDIAVIDSSLFDLLWEQTFIRFCQLGPWGAVQDFQRYFFRGWIRPDKFPRQFPYRSEWFDAFRIIGRDVLNGRHIVSGGIYKSREFLLRYQETSVRNAAARMELAER